MRTATLGLVYFLSGEPPNTSSLILEVIIYCVPTVYCVLHTWQIRFHLRILAKKLVEYRPHFSCEREMTSYRGTKL